MVWPPYSPDMNPIENLWSVLKGKVHQVPGVNRQAMEERVRNVWQHDDGIMSACISLSNSMVTRVQALIRCY
jgi:hypothetical protein